MSEKILRLTLKKKWFDMISSGEKKEEYREIKGYWCKRLLTDVEINYHFVNNLDTISALVRDRLDMVKYSFINYTHVEFKHGYAKDAPTIKLECLGIEIGTAKPEWSDNWQGNVFKIKLGAICNV